MKSVIMFLIENFDFIFNSIMTANFIAGVWIACAIEHDIRKKGYKLSE